MAIYRTTERGLALRKQRVIVTAALAAVMAVAPLAAATASTTSRPPVAVKHGTYQFASNNGAAWQIGQSPVATSQAAETFLPTGVELATHPDQGGPYADAGVIVPLGRLSGLFHDGTYVAPKIAELSPPDVTVGLNLYFDSDGNGGYLAFASNGVYVGPGGDNLASMNGDSADFSNFEQGNTSIGLTGTMTMEQVLAAYQARTSGTTNPEVWAWVGVSGATAQEADVQSVAGHQLITAATAIDVRPYCTTVNTRYYARWQLNNSFGDRTAKVAYAARVDGRWKPEGTVTIAAYHYRNVKVPATRGVRVTYADGFGYAVTGYGVTTGCIQG
jgi:hypothetical protein